MPSRLYVILYSSKYNKVDITCIKVNTNYCIHTYTLVYVYLYTLSIVTYATMLWNNRYVLVQSLEIYPDTASCL